jgi:hypothetical protein
MAKIELTLKINGVDQDMPALGDAPLDLQRVGDISSAVTLSLMAALNEEQAEAMAASEAAEIEAARVEAETINAQHEETE